MMTTYDLDTLTLANIGEEATGENREAYAPMFLNAYNEAYFTLCNSTLRPVAGEAVQLDADKRFDPAALAKKLATAGIISVKPHRDYCAEFQFIEAPELLFLWMEDGLIAVPGAEALGEVYVIYRCLPDSLVNATPTVPGSGNEPVFLPEECHGTLASYAAAAFFRVRRKFERMQVWMETYLSAVRDMPVRADPSAGKLKNIYRPMP